MNPIFIQNNLGLSFIYQGDRSIHVKDKFGIDLGEAPYIYLNDLTHQEMESINASEGEDRERLVTQFLHDRFATLGKKNRTFEVQCYIHENRPFIVFEPYGLQGGGFKKFAALAAGVGKVASGILLTAGSVAATVATAGAAAPSLTAALTGAGLLSSGIGDMAYALRTSEENMSLKDYATQSAIGFAAGAAGGAAGVGVNAVAGPSLHILATTALSGAASTAASTTASTVTEAAIKGDKKVLKRLTAKRLVTSAAVGVLTGGVSSIAKSGVESGSQFLLNSSTTAATDLAAKAAVGAAAGAASSSAVKITENYISQHTFLQVTYGSKPDDQLLEPGKLYVYILNSKIHFQSIDAKGQGRITVIKAQENFLLPFEKETQIEKIISILESNGRREFNAKQKKFILESAAKHHHVPLKLLSGVADAAAVGASSGAVIGLTKAATDRMKASAPQIKKEETKPSKPHRPLVKRVRLESQTTSQKESKTTEGNLIRRRTTYEVKKPENQDTQKPQSATVTTEKRSLLSGKRVRVEQKRDLPKISSVAEEKIGEDRSSLKRRVSQVQPSEHDIKKSKGDVAQAASKTEEKNPVSLLGKRTKTETQTASGESSIQTKKIGPRASALLGKKFRHTKDGSSESKKLNPGTKAKQVLESEKKEAACVLIQGTPEQIDAAQKSVDKANQQHSNLMILSTYSPVDAENKATEIYNDSKNSGLGIKYIEQTLSDRYGIPMGTLTDSLKAAYESNPDEYVPTPIMNALLAKKNDGNAIPNAKLQVDNATNALNYLKEPRCTTSVPQTQPQVVPTFNILQLVNDAANEVGKNVNVQMRYLTTRLVGTDHGDLFDKVYTVYLDASFKWEAYQGKDKPTQYGFLTSVTDLIVNGTTTVPVEIKKQQWWQSALGFLGTSGVGFQLNGSGLQMGTMNQPNLVTVYSTEKPAGIEGFQLPPSSSQSPSQPLNILPTSLTPAQPSVVPLPAQLPSQAPTTSTPVSAQPSISAPIPTQPSGLTGGSAGKTPQHVEINPLAYVAADTVQPLLQGLNKMPGLEGLGSYASGAIEKVTVTLSALERANDPDFQNEPPLQQMACGLWGTAIEVVGVSPSAPIALVNPALGAGAAAVLSPLANQAGDDAQQNCHDVINMFKPTS